jgi:hypothetical protein
MAHLIRGGCIRRGGSKNVRIEKREGEKNYCCGRGVREKPKRHGGQKWNKMIKCNPSKESPHTTKFRNTGNAGNWTP